MSSKGSDEQDLLNTILLPCVHMRLSLFDACTSLTCHGCSSGCLVSFWCICLLCSSLLWNSFDIGDTCINNYCGNVVDVGSMKCMFSGTSDVMDSVLLVWYTSTGIVFESYDPNHFEVVSYGVRERPIICTDLQIRTTFGFVQMLFGFVQTHPPTPKSEHSRQKKYVHFGTSILT